MHYNGNLKTLIFHCFFQGYVDGKILKLGSHANDNKKSNEDLVSYFYIPEHCFDDIIVKHKILKKIIVASRIKLHFS